jgi:hypothetical protein
MIIRRICAAVAALALPVTLLATNAPAAQALSGRCPSWTHSVGDGPKDIINSGNKVGVLDVRYSREQTTWCVEVQNVWYEAKLNAKYRADPYWGPDTVGVGTLHLWLDSNGGKCLDAWASVGGTEAAITRCRP